MIEANEVVLRIHSSDVHLLWGEFPGEVYLGGLSFLVVGGFLISMN